MSGKTEIWMNFQVNFSIFQFFFMVKWVLNERNISSEWQCVVCKPKSQQERFIVASIETTKQILAWFTSTRESGNLVENCNSNQLKDIEFFGNHDWEVVINLTIWFLKPFWRHTWNKMPPKMQIWMKFQSFAGWSMF